MKKLILFLSVIFVFILSLTATTIIYAAEPSGSESVEPETTEVVEEEQPVETTTNDDVEVDFETAKAYLKKYLGEFSDLLITLGIVGVISIITCFIGLATAIYKLKKAKIEAIDAKTESEQKAKAAAEKQNEEFKKGIDEMKQMYTSLFNNLTDEQKATVIAANEENNALIDTIVNR